MATLKDVAALAGVGMSTASRAISGAGPVSPAALKKVLAAVEQLNFRPSSIGRSLSSKSLGMIGIYTPSFFGAYYGTILQQTDIELRAIRRHVVVATGCGEGDRREETIEAVNFLIDRDCDGIVVLAHDLREEDMQALHKKQARIAFLNRRNPAAPETGFCPDHYRGGELAAQALIDAGHRQFAIISGPATAFDNIERVGGFYAQLERHGIARSNVQQVDGDFSRDSGYAAAARLLDQGMNFTGLFCANDEMAVGALACLHQRGISVPQQVSVIGYDDDYTAEYSVPALTSVHIPMQEVTRNAVRWLLNLCYGTRHEIVRDYPITVSMRATLAPPPNHRGATPAAN